jgi:hypothetical protein
MFPLLVIIFSNTNHFTSASSDEEILEDMDGNNMAIFHCRVIDCDFDKIFTSHEIEDMMGQSVNARVGV